MFYVETLWAHGRSIISLSLYPWDFAGVVSDIRHHLLILRDRRERGKGKIKRQKEGHKWIAMSSQAASRVYVAVNKSSYTINNFSFSTRHNKGFLFRSRNPVLVICVCRSLF